MRATSLLLFGLPFSTSLRYQLTRQVSEHGMITIVCGLSHKKGYDERVSDAGHWCDSVELSILLVPFPSSVHTSVG